METKQIVIMGFHIVSPGDPSVGILSQTTNVYGPFYFEDQHDLEGFRNKLLDAFRYYWEDCNIETFEEREKWMKEEEEQMRKAGQI